MKLPKLAPPKLLAFLSYGDTPQPARDWIILLITGFILLLISLGWNIWFFGQVVNQEPEVELAESSSSLEAQPLQDVNHLFESRAAIEAQYLGDLHFVDPSR